MFFIKISFLSAKKSKLVFCKFILFLISVFKFKTEPRAIKLSNKFLSSKKTSNSIFSFPCFILLLIKLVKLDGLKFEDIFFNFSASN